MTRVLVKTGSPLWLVNAADPEGKKVRKNTVTDEDQIFDNILEAQEALSVLEKAHGKGSSNGSQADRPEPQSMVAETGKILVGKTLEIRCEWKEKGKRCTNTRHIKPQDKFQVHFCVEHQAENRKRLRRERQRARAASRKAAA